jgi:hypothetical protein
MILWWLTRGRSATCGVTVEDGYIVQAPPLIRWVLGAPRYPAPLAVPWRSARAILIRQGWHGQPRVSR